MRMGDGRTIKVGDKLWSECRGCVGVFLHTVTGFDEYTGRPLTESEHDFGEADPVCLFVSEQAAKKFYARLDRALRQVLPGE